MRDPLLATGWVIASAPDGPRFAGTCFGFRQPHQLLTAAHCVRDLRPEDITVTVTSDSVERGLAVLSISRHPTADLALLTISDMMVVFDVFRDVAPIPEWGAEVSAFGYPEDTTPGGTLPTPRYFRGHVQRMFDHDSHLGYRYAATELSFPAPGGLSGGPVAPRRDPSRVFAIVAENKLATTYLHTVSDLTSGGERVSERVHSTIEYGIAVLLAPVTDWLASVTRGV